MHAEEPLLDEIRANPDDDSPRLIYADWLEERGDPRAEFIRVQCELARISTNDARQPVLEAREAAILEEHRARWLAPLEALGAIQIEFCRGLVEEFKINAETFLAAGTELFRAAPGLRSLRLLRSGPFIEALTQSPLLSRLHALALRVNLLDADAADLLAKCPHVSGLKKLDLSGNSLVEEGARSLARSPHLQNLTALDLWGNMIGNAGTAAIANATFARNLRSLELGMNRIGNRGAGALVRSVYLTNLSQLGLNYNQIAEPHGEELKRRYGDATTLVGNSPRRL